MTATMPTAEEFLATPYPEDEPEVEALEALPSDPLTSIAASLGLLTSIIVRRDRQDQEDAESEQALHQLDAEYAELQAEAQRLRQLIDDTLKLCSKSTSKLANNVRALLEVDTVTAEPEAEIPEHEPGSGPAHDDPVEVWRAYAKSAISEEHEQYALIDQYNRAQIRTLLGLAQTQA